MKSIRIFNDSHISCKNYKINLPYLKEYKRIKKAEKSNLGEVKKLGLTDQFGGQL